MSPFEYADEFLGIYVFRFLIFLCISDACALTVYEPSQNDPQVTNLHVYLFIGVTSSLQVSYGEMVGCDNAEVSK